MAAAQDITFKIITIPTVGKWVKIGEVYKSAYGNPFKSTYRKFAVLEFIEESGMRKYKEVYMASDDRHIPDLKSQSCELELNK